MIKVKSFSGKELHVIQDAIYRRIIYEIKPRLDSISHTVGQMKSYVRSFNPSNNHMYVTNAASNTVSVIDSSSNTVIGTINVGNYPVGIAFNPSNNHMYVTNFYANTVSVIDSSSNTVIGTIIVGSDPQFSAFNPTNNDMYVTKLNNINSLTIFPKQIFGYYYC